MSVAQPGFPVPPTGPGTSLSDLIEYAEEACNRVENHGRIRAAQVLHHGLIELLNNEEPKPLIQTLQFKRLPVTIDEFVESPDFLSDSANVWPSLMGDLRAISLRIALEDPRAALGVAERIERAANRLERFPLRGRVVPELRDLGVPGYRELIVAPWRVMYAVREREVFVWAVIDGRRNVEDVLLERLTREL